MEKKNIFEWLNKTIASLQSHLQYDFDYSTNTSMTPVFKYPPNECCGSFSQDYLQKQRVARIKSIDAAFDKFPQLEKICKDWNNNVLDSCFNKFIFEDIPLDHTGEFEVRENYFMNFINLAGINLIHLNVQKYPYSRMMQLINTNCSNLKILELQFKEMKSQDFEDVFSNMPHLKSLSINWQCEDSNLPDTLVTSLEQIGGILEIFLLECSSNENDFCLPDSLVSVFPRLIALKNLNINGFQVSQPLFQSIGKMKNLEGLMLKSDLLDTFKNNKKGYPVGIFQNLRELLIDNDDSITDEFLIHLCNNSEKLELLCIMGTNLTDNGIIALNNLRQLNWLSLNSCLRLINLKKKFITDKSIQYLSNKKLEYLCLSNCSEITNRSVIKLIHNLPNLESLNITNTKVTYDIVQEISKLKKFRKKTLDISVSFNDRDDSFKLLKESNNIMLIEYIRDN